MENLEEVLQALDEFQKMRPTEIPRELEEYLCWVAKTGDPVYQWPMIKTLFREKLTRVMTDFYESCPTLELAACPNVEHFNYDTMKSNLLERLESFANAPFTVQRICELLTAPRKEYNRVDKFMRAIEKNILVVSTREPGPINRRGETGDGMVNGSVEEDTASVTQQQQQLPPPSPPPSPSPQTTQSTAQSAQPTTQQPSAAQDVEMEYWEKDCASTVTISVHTVENEASLLHTVVPGAANSAAAGGTLAKNAVFAADEAAREKLEQAVSRSSDQLTTSNFVGATSGFSAISNLTSQVEQSHEPVVSVAATSVVQNLSAPAEAIVAEDSLGSADVADAIMNEDTNSQASLDMENDEVDPATTVTTTTAATTTTTVAATVTATATTTLATGTTSPSTTASITSASSSPSSSSSSSLLSSSSSSSTSSSSSSSSSATTTVTVVATVIPLTTDTTRNLQAAFQAKRFEDADDKCSDKSNEKTTAPSAAVADSPGLVHSTKSGETTETNTECGDVNGISRDESRITESSLKTDVAGVASGDDEAGGGVADEERLPSKAEEEVEASPRLSDVDEEKSRCQDAGSVDIAQMVFAAEPDNAVASDECASVPVVSPGEASHRTEKTELQSKGTCATTTTTATASSSPKDNRLLHDQTASQKPNSSDVVTEQVLESIPRLASPRSDEQMGQELHCKTELNGDGAKMMEVSNDKAALVESMAVESVKTSVEKAKEAGATAIEKLDSSVSPVVEMTDGSVADVVCPCPQDDALMPVAEDDGTTAEQVKVKQSSVVKSAACRREPHDQVEMMEVDEDEESASTFQQQQPDEQMEHETMEELSKS